jgi:hypothetical protein
MQSKKLVMGLPNLKDSIRLCEGCIFGKHHQMTYPRESTTQATKLLALIHIDVYGSMQTTSLAEHFTFCFSLMIILIILMCIF